MGSVPSLLRNRKGGAACSPGLCPGFLSHLYDQPIVLFGFCSTLCPWPGRAHWSWQSPTPMTLSTCKGHEFITWCHCPKPGWSRVPPPHQESTLPRCSPHTSSWHHHIPATASRQCFHTGDALEPLTTGTGTFAQLQNRLNKCLLDALQEMTMRFANLMLRLFLLISGLSGKATPGPPPHRLLGAKCGRLCLSGKPTVAERMISPQSALQLLRRVGLYVWDRTPDLGNCFYVLRSAAILPPSRTLRLHTWGLLFQAPRIPVSINVVHSRPSSVALNQAT